MRVFKWGNDLAVLLPAAAVQALKLKEGDEIEVHVTSRHVSDIRGESSREEALGRIRSLSRTLPADWKFDRDEANAR